MAKVCRNTPGEWKGADARKTATSGRFLRASRAGVVFKGSVCYWREQQIVVYTGNVCEW